MTIYERLRFLEIVNFHVVSAGMAREVNKKLLKKFLVVNQIISLKFLVRNGFFVGVSRG
jgi:hypothetical protein